MTTARVDSITAISGTALLAMLLISTSSYAKDEYPTSGIVRNTVEASSLTYECTLADPKTLDCEFVQVSLRNSKSKSDAEKELKGRIGKKIDWEKEMGREECSNMGEYLSYLEQTRKPPAELKSKIDTLTMFERRELTALINAFVRVCKTHAPEDLQALYQLTLDRDVRSCKISTNSFRQTFQVVSDGLQSNIWVVKAEPSGSCGIVQLSRFEPVATVIGNSKFVNWNYIAKKIITNRNGKTPLGGDCKDFDEGEYEYNWQSKTWTKGCDYIEFGY